MDTYDLVRELAGTICRCGHPKRRRETFCRDCYYRLSPPMRRALYAPVGDGYEEAYAAAVASLEGTGVPMPIGTLDDAEEM